MSFVALMVGFLLPMALFRQVYLVVLAIFGLLLFRFAKKLPERPLIFWAAIASLFWGTAVGAMQASSLRHGLGVFLSWVVIPAGLMALLPAAPKKIKQWFGSGLLAGLLLTVFLVLLQAAHYPPRWEWQSAADLGQYFNTGRLVGPFISPNTLALYAVPLIFLLLGRTKSKSQQFALVATMALILLSSQSVGGLLAALLGIVFALALVKLPKHRLYVFGTLALASAASFFINWSVRREIWQGAYTLLKHHWLFGLGIGNFQAAYTELVKDSAHLTQYVVPYALFPHNLILSTLSEAGLFGLIGLGLLFGYAFWAQLRRPNPNLWYLAALLAILIHGFVDTPFWQASLAPLTLIILAFAMDEHE